jgi:hypothetical protein
MDPNRKTIAQLKEELTTLNIDFTDIERKKGRKLDYVKRYTDTLESIRETQRQKESDSKKPDSKDSDSKDSDSKKSDSKESDSKESDSKESDSKKSEIKRPDSKESDSKEPHAKASLETESPKKSALKENEDVQVLEKAEIILDAITQSVIMDSSEISLEKDELIISLVILGHGCENLVQPWGAKSPISRYFRNNVRVYSRACVPDTITLGNTNSNVGIINDINRRFSNQPRNETSSIISAYANDSRFDYQKDILYNLQQHKKESLTGRFGPRFEKFSIFENIERASDLSAFLSNKDFGFYDSSRREKVLYGSIAYKTLGVHVVDIRVKKTNNKGEVIYEKIFSPSDYAKMDSTNFNLIYSDGIKFMFKNIFKKPKLVNRALETLGFKPREQRIMDLSLEQLYEFLMLLNVSYANIMDFSCRSCSIGILPQNLADTIYNMEQKFAVKPTAFGLRKSIKENKRNIKQKTRRRSRAKTQKRM